MNASAPGQSGPARRALWAAENRGLRKTSGSGAGAEAVGSRAPGGLLKATEPGSPVKPGVRGRATVRLSRCRRLKVGPERFPGASLGAFCANRKCRPRPPQGITVRR